MKKIDFIVGMGEVGMALLDLFTDAGMRVVCLDKGDSCEAKARFMHVAIPYSSKFSGVVRGYMRKYEPDAVIIHSTVPVGTTAKIKGNVFHSFVRGTHPHLAKDLKRYVKFYAPFNQEVEGHLKLLGMKPQAMLNTNETELCKLLNTTQYRCEIQYANLAQAACKKFGVRWKAWEDTVRTTADYVPRVLRQPSFGKVKGHCVQPNSELLYKQFPSPFLKELKQQEVFNAKRE